MAATSPVSPSTTSCAPPARVAIAGKMGSGKSAVAAHLARRLGARRTSFARKVRAVVADVYGPGHEKDRRLLTGVGMGLRRVDPDTWVNAVRRATAGAGAWVLDDLRFPNELAALRGDGWLLVRLAVDDGVRARRLAARYGGDRAAQDHLPYAGHASETSLDETPDAAFDVVVRQDAVGRTSVARAGRAARHTGSTPDDIAVAIAEAADAAAVEAADTQ